MSDRSAPTFALAILLLVGVVGAQDPWKDTRAGYVIATLPKWVKIPVAPDERYSLAKWAAKNDPGNFQTEMEVLLFRKTDKPAPKSSGASTPRPGPPGTGTGDDGAPDNPAPDKPTPERPVGSREDFEERFRSKSYEEYMKGRRATANGMPKPTREVAIKGVEAKMRIFDITEEIGTRGGKPVNAWIFAGVIDLPDRQFVVQFTASDTARKKFTEDFTSIAKSFRLLSAKELDEAEDEAAIAGLSEKQKALRAATLSAKQVPGWWVRESTDYIIVTSVPVGKSEMIDLVLARLKAMRKQYEKDFPPPQKIEAVSLVRVCANEKEYHDYGGPGGSAGYWNSHAKELVLYAGKGKEFTLQVLNHEAFHQYIFYCFGELAPHSWFNEGYGDYYSGCVPEGSSILVRPFAWRTEIIKKAMRAKAYVPVKDIVTYSQGQYYAAPDLCYAEGWSLIYFLNQGLPKGHPWRKILTTYTKVIVETKDEKKAVEAAWDGVDYANFEAAWINFIVKDQQASATQG